MRRFVILTTIIIYFGMSSYAQENINMIEILNIEQDIVLLENRITSLIKKKPEIANIQGLRQYHVLWLGSYTNKKEDYLDYSFLFHIGYDYYHLSSNSLFQKKQQYIKATTLITDSVGNLIAVGDARLVHIASVFNPNDIKLAKMIFYNNSSFKI